MILVGILYAGLDGVIDIVQGWLVRDYDFVCQHGLMHHTDQGYIES